MADNIIEIKNLTKKYGDFTAVDQISFHVEKGEIFGILGPNGAGKTTTLEMIEGLKGITAGEIILDGMNVAIMDHAKVVKLDTPFNLLRHTGVGSTITFRTDKQCPVEHFQKLPAVEKATAEDHGFRLLTGNPEATLPALFSHEQGCNFKMFNLQLRQATLEDVFLKLTGSKLRE